MEKIIIENIGPLKNVVIEPKKVMILIGEQGTGKSIIARILHYGRLIENEVNEVLNMYINRNISFNNEHNFEYALTSRIEYFISKLGFGFTGKITFKINYYSEISYNCLNSYISYNIDFNILNELKINTSNEQINKEENIQKSSFVLPAERITYQIIANNNFPVQNISKDVEYDIYISYLKRINDLYTLYPKNKDAFYKQFYEFVEDQFMISYSKDRIDSTKVSYVVYDYNKNPIRLEYNNLSAGYKELFSIIQITSALLFNSSNQQFIIEEPENNLFPVTIDKLIKMLAMFSNAPEKNNSLVISTHSPYVLMSLNRLLYAGWLSKKLTNSADIENLNKIVPEHLQLNEDDFVCYNVKNGGIESVMEDWGSGNMQISTDFINGISETLGEVTDELIALDPTI